MRPKYRVILEDCIEYGVRRGYDRAHKHVEKPGVDAIQYEIENAIMGRIYEYFTFDDEIQE